MSLQDVSRVLSDLGLQRRECSCVRVRTCGTGIALLTLRSLCTGVTGVTGVTFRTSTGRAPSAFTGTVIGQHIAGRAAIDVDTGGIDGGGRRE